MHLRLDVYFIEISTKVNKGSDIVISTFNRWFMVFKYNSPVNSRNITKQAMT